MATFRKIASVNASKDQPVSVSKWMSPTGIKIYLAQTEGPMIYGTLCFATQALDNDGLPHCIEHLIYMGSEGYPYKGMMDKLASRCLSQGLNATTESDHTSYQLFTAGANGFFTILPIFLDHVFFPLLQESAYLTEIHHVNGRGEDGGVLYSEMLARETKDHFIISDEVMKRMYPDQCGYSYNTGAMLENLRTSTTLAKVKQYHRSFYRPENLNLIIAGDVDQSAVFEVIKSFETKLRPRMTQNSYVKPWQEHINPLTETSSNTIYFPSVAEEFGHVMIAWRGPPATDHYTLACCVTILEYLTGSGKAPLTKKLVSDMEICACIQYHVYENKESCFKFAFDKIALTRLNEVNKIVEDELASIVRDQNIDMEKINRIIHFQILDAMSMLELDEQQDTVTDMCIGDALYGTSTNDFNMRLNSVKTQKNMKNHSSSFWLNLIDKWFVKSHKVVVIGKPSKDLLTHHGNVEKSRVLQRQNILGPERLNQLELCLQEAMKKNEVEPPDELIASVPVPSIQNLKFHYFNSINNYDPQRNIYPLMSIQFDFQLDDLHTNIVQVSALIDTSSLEHRLRFYLPLMTSLIFNVQMKLENEVLDRNDVSDRLYMDTLFYTATLGINGQSFHCGSYPQLFVIMLNMERKKYENGVLWLKKLLMDTMFLVDDIEHSCKKLLAVIDEHKLTSHSVINSIMNDLLFLPECNIYATSIFRQQKFLRQLLEKLKSSPDLVISDLNSIRGIFLNPSNIRVHMAVDVELLARKEKRFPIEPWQNFLDSSANDSTSTQPRVKRRRRCRMLPTWQYIRPLRNVSQPHCMMGIAGDESVSMTVCVSSIHDSKHPELIALQVFLRYLSQEEGPLWKLVRGNGVVYAFRIEIQSDRGLLTLSLSPCSDVVQAFMLTKNTIMDICSGKIQLKHLDLENAITTLMVEIIKNKLSGQGECEESKLMFYRKVSHEYNKRILMTVAGVTIPEMKRIGLKYIKPLFDAKRCRSVICCHPSKVSVISAAFRPIGFNYGEIPNTENNMLYTL